VHILVPGTWSVQRGHDYVELLEGQLRALDPGFNVVTHLEPIEDVASFDDAQIVG
jgi:divalent metal cation (Fe/Co/Zn/Cd) transporter